MAQADQSTDDFETAYESSEGNFFSIYRPYFAMLRNEPSSQLLAIVFAELINVGSMDFRGNKERHKRNEGWFICSAKRLMRTFCTSDKTQCIWIRRLVEIGLIETKQKGIPARRWIRINFALRSEMLANVGAPSLELPEVEEGQELDEDGNFRTRSVKFDGTGNHYVTSPVKFDGTIPPKFDGTNIKEPINKKNKDVATPPGPAVPTELTTPRNGSNPNQKRRQDKLAHPFDERALAHFRLTLDLAKVKYNSKHKSKWLNELRLLREYDHAEMDDIKLVLKWYREYYPSRRGTDGTFTAHCIPTLRKKFFRFLAAAQDAKKNPKTIVNGIQLLTAKDAEKIHETESNIGYCHHLEIHPDWYVGDFYENPSAHYQLMADIINESIRNDPDDQLDWRRHLREFGVGYLVKKHEG